jgi:hypothetical protein
VCLRRAALRLAKHVEGQPDQAVFQHRVLKKLGPELEVNIDFFLDGDLAGRKQVFLSLALLAGVYRAERHCGLSELND